MNPTYWNHSTLTNDEVRILVTIATPLGLPPRSWGQKRRIETINALVRKGFLNRYRSKRPTLTHDGKKAYAEIKSRAKYIKSTKRFAVDEMPIRTTIGLQLNPEQMRLFQWLGCNPKSIRQPPGMDTVKVRHALRCLKHMGLTFNDQNPTLTSVGKQLFLFLVQQFTAKHEPKPKPKPTRAARCIRM